MIGRKNRLEKKVEQTANEKVLFGEGSNPEVRERMRARVEVMVGEGMRGVVWGRFCQNAGHPVNDSFLVLQREVMQIDGSDVVYMEEASRRLSQTRCGKKPSNEIWMRNAWSFFNMVWDEEVMPDPRPVFERFRDAYKMLLSVQEQLERMDKELARVSEEEESEMSRRLFGREVLLKIATKDLLSPELWAMTREYHWIVRENEKQ